MDNCTVWLLCYDPEWLEARGDTGMAVSPPMPLEDARMRQRVLSRNLPNGEFEVRDGDGNPVPAEPGAATPHEASVKRARRVLGGRGR